MDFGKALEALNDGKIVRRPGMLSISLEDGIMYTQPKDRLRNIDTESVLSDDWEIVPDVPELNAEEVLSEFRAWLEASVKGSCGIMLGGNPYYNRCLEKLNETSTSKTIEVKLPVTGTAVLMHDNQFAVLTESGQFITPTPTKVKLPAKGEVVYISGNEGVVRTESHKLVIIQLPGVNL